MLSFHKKIFLSFVLAFTVIVAVLFPFTASIVTKISYKAMEDKSEELIAKLQNAPNNDALIRRLKEQRVLFFPHERHHR